MTTTDVLPPMSAPGPVLANAPKGEEGTFHFFDEADGQLLVEALEGMTTYPPDLSATAAMMGKSVEACMSYASLYLQALSSRQKLNESNAVPRLTASEVYAFHGIGEYYRDFLQRRGAASGHSSTSPGRETPNDASSKTASPVGGYSQAINSGMSGSKSSISFLCQPEAAASPSAARELSDPSALGREHHQAPAEGAGAAKNEGDGGSPGPRPKRQRQETATEDSQILAVPHDALWEYSAMQESILDQARNRGKNPWDWVRKVINKSNGYAQWWPFFSEYVILTKREACEDLKNIRAKAPPPPPQEVNPYSRKFEKGAVAAPALSGAGKYQKQAKGSRASPEASEAPPPAKKAKTAKGSEGRLLLQPGDFIEVKWGLDWWHAQVVKVGRTSRTGFVWVSYVGGTEEDEEWIAFENIRLPREDVSQMVKGKKGGDAMKTVRKKASALA